MTKLRDWHEFPQWHCQDLAKVSGRPTVGGGGPQQWGWRQDQWR